MFAGAIQRRTVSLRPLVCTRGLFVHGANREGAPPILRQPHLDIGPLHRPVSLETNLERWCYLFGNLNTFVETPENPAGFDDVFEIARTEVLGGNELKKYVASMVDKYTIYTTTEYARREGHKEGVKEGMEKGIEKGREEGIEKGREEGIAIGAKEKALEIAGKALAMGMPVEQVAELSGLSVEELKEALA